MTLLENSLPTPLWYDSITGTYFSGNLQNLYYEQPKKADGTAYTLAECPTLEIWIYEVPSIGSQELVFHSVYYLSTADSSSPSTTIYDFRRIIEDYMQLYSLSYAKFTIQARAAGSTTSRSMRVIYCPKAISESNMLASDFLDTHFFILGNSRLIAPDDSFRLTLYKEYPDDYIQGDYTIITTHHTFVYTDPQTGEIATSVYSNYGRYGYGFTSIVVNPKTLAENNNIPIENLHAITVAVDYRIFTLYIRHNPVSHSFYFRNLFNAWETLSVPATTTRKMKTSQSIARLDSLSLPYDISHQRSFSTETAALIADDAQRFEEFFASPEIRVVEKDAYYPEFCPLAIITDYTLEIPDSPNTGLSVSFDWQFANTHEPLLVNANTQGVFTEQFTEQFT